jgi:hypothetical protein
MTMNLKPVEPSALTATPRRDFLRSARPRTRPAVRALAVLLLGGLGAACWWAPEVVPSLALVLAFGGLVAFLAGLLPIGLSFAVQFFVRQPLPGVVPWLLAATLVGAGAGMLGLPRLGPALPWWASCSVLALLMVALASFFRVGAAACRRCFPQRFGMAPETAVPSSS